MRIFNNAMDEAFNMTHKLASVSNKSSITAANNIGAIYDDMDMISQQLLIFIFFTNVINSYNFILIKYIDKILQ